MKKKRFIALLWVTFLSGSMIIYYVNWFKNSFILDKGETTPELAQEYVHCKKMMEEISQKVAIPDEIMTPSRKAISCRVLLSFAMTKYKQIIVYGVVDQSQQKMIEEIIQQNIGRGLPIELVIYERENWKQVGQVGTVFKRQKENQIYDRWFDHK